MKKYIYISIFLFAVLAFASSCNDDWTEPKTIDVDLPEVGTDAYYANLRDYKNSDHQIAFGWFGGWTASGPSMVTRLFSIPDSVDMIGLWGNMWHRDKMTPEKFEDLRLTKEIKGTKILVTTLLGWTGKELPNIPEEDWGTDRQEGLRKYAKALAEEIIDLGFDGLDIDYEPNVGGPIDVRDCPRGEDMIVFVEELGKYLGPKSNSGKLLVVDGELNVLPTETGPYFDYAIAQAYSTTSGSNLQSRYNRISSIFKPEQFIVTEDFEAHWRTGGVTYVEDDGTRVPSILGMAKWNPTQGVKGGCGTYHMEYEYRNSEMEYKYLRQAIQIMNPKVK
ncbi:endoglycosidase [Dysgonomonas sp. Marseille-P4677]|uniref:glycoside hydrolase family 18 n=1 Tax=Dysgonomonas sp. Marseille-P4677 TaxID=2364790 RepID=UPI001913DDC5|nr:glycoside hydrolase family 18 [Dysgonomonas sp. Marseille-P4677]MBK5722743.1 endoglycosidase [Dysgonomonas sp. Marseille-P4677]